MNSIQKPFRLESICDPAPEMSEAVKTGLRQFNSTNNPDYHEAVARPENSRKHLNVFAFDHENKICGGVLASTQLHWLYIEYLFVMEDFRGQDIGAELMKMAESEAVQRGCKYAYLDTMDFQAPNFYRKLGYVVVGQLDDRDSFGHTMFYFRKELA